MSLMAISGVTEGRHRWASGRWMDSHGPEPGWIPPSASTGRWRRVGVLSALVWVGVGLGLAYLSAALGAPTLSGWLAIIAGPVAFGIVGSLHGLSGQRDRARAGCLGLAVALGIFTIGIMVYVMSLDG